MFSNTTVKKHQVSQILLNLNLQNRKPKNLYLQKKGDMLIYDIVYIAAPDGPYASDDSKITGNRKGK